VIPGKGDRTKASAAKCVRTTLIAGCLCAGSLGAALAQKSEPSTPAVPAASATPVPQQIAPQQPAPQTSAATLQLGLPPQSSAPGATVPPATAEKPGFFDDFARWWRDSVADFNAKIKEQQSKLDDFNKKSAEAAQDAATATQQAMKNAADAVVKSTTSKVIETRAPCAIAGNGAADCATAAVNACKSKGFSDGQPLDVRTAEKCSASLWLQGQGQRQTSADCPIETVVLRAACQ
jgi:hypothetical protein